MVSSRAVMGPAATSAMIVLAVAIAPARAGLVLGSASLTSDQRADLQDASYNNGNYGHPYDVTGSYSQNSSGPSTVTSPFSANSYSTGAIAMSTSGSGTASVSPSASAFDALVVDLDVTMSVMNPADTNTYAGSNSTQYYSITFTPNATAAYTLSLTVDSRHVYSVGGFFGGDDQEAFGHLYSYSGPLNIFLDSQTSGPVSSTGTKTLSTSVVLNAGETYGFIASASSTGYIRNDSSYTAVGSISGSSRVSAVLSVPEPASLALTGGGLALGWLRRRLRKRPSVA